MRTKGTIFFTGVIFLNLFAVNLLIAQTGPGGVGNSDGSSGQPKNVIWLDAGTIGVGDGSSISSWNDASGNNNNFLQPTSSNQPNFTSSNSSINNQPSVTFSRGGGGSGDDDRLVLSGFSEMPSDNITVFCVYDPSTNNEGIISYNTSTDDNEFLIFNSNSLTQFIDGSTEDSGINYQAGGWTILGTKWRSLDGDIRFYQDGNEAANGILENGGIIDNSGTMVIGGEQDSEDGGYENNQAFDGEMAEIIIYDGYLNEAQRQIIENYLAEKYGLTLSSGDVYSASSHINDIVGVGIQNGETHDETNSAGMTLSIYDGTFDTNGEFVMAGHDGTTNAVSTANLDVGIEERWSRTWYMDFTGTANVEVTFDLDEGIGGEFPQNKDDYVLLFDNSGTYEEVTIPNGNKSITGSKISFEFTSGLQQDGVYTLGTTDAANSPVDGAANQTWYSYTSGDWSDPGTWTLDGATTPTYINPDNEVPSDIDDVVITNSRTVTIQSGTNNLATNSIEIVGRLDLTSSSGHNFNDINGNGRIFMEGASGSDNFPDGDITDFADATNGGTVEIRGSAGLNLDQDRTFNNLEVNLSSGDAVLISDYTLNGNLTVTNGSFQINEDGASGDGNNYNITVNGNVLVEATGEINTGTGNARHQFNFYGDFTNEGTVEFTNRGTAIYSSEATDGIVDANFLHDTQDQSIVCNGTTNFYRIEIDKGTDETYVLNISASAASNFNLYGAANYAHGSVGQLTSNDNALGLIKGTVKIGGNVNVPVLNNGGNYNISEAARLWVNGGSVGKSNGTAVVIYGTLRLSSGSITASVNSGLTTRNDGNIIVEGGTLTANQIRTSTLGSENVGGYSQSGGTVNVTGNSINNDYYVFSLTYSGNTFNMSGGTLNVSGVVALSDNTGGSSGEFHGGGIFINSDEGKYNVTGGTVIMDNTTANNFKVTSNAPFYNVVMRNSGGSADEIDLDGGTSGIDNPGSYQTINSPTLKVLNDLTVEGGVTFDPNGNNIEIGGDLNIGDGAIWDVPLNTTPSAPYTLTFNGSGTSVLNLQNVKSESDCGTCGGNNYNTDQQFSSLIIDKPDGERLELDANPAKDAAIAGDANPDANNLVKIVGTFNLKGGIFDVTDYSVRLETTDVIIDGTLVDFTPGVSDEDAMVKIRQATFTIQNTADAVIGNLRFRSNNDIVTLANDIYIKRLQYQSGLFNITDNNLKVDDWVTNLKPEADFGGCGGCYSVEDMIVTSGNASDGGISLLIDGNDTYNFHFGIGITKSEPGSKYTPATATVSDYSDDGYITMRPIDNVLNLTNTSGGDVLSYYWKVGHEGFSTLPTAEYEFTYYDDDLDGSGNESSFVPGSVQTNSPFERSYEDDDVPESETVDDGNNLITFNGQTDNGFTLEEASYTAGETSRFSGSVEVFYTRQLDDGAQVDWTETSYWTLAPNPSFGVHSSNQPAASDYPQEGDIAVIGWVPYGEGDPNEGQPHGIAINNTETMAELRFSQMLDAGGNPTERVYAYNFQFRPCVVVNTGGEVDADIVSGEGMFWVRDDGGGLSDPDWSDVDLGQFNDQDSSYFVYESRQDPGTYVNIPSEMPNFLLATDGWGANDKSNTIEKDLTINVDLELLGDINFLLSTTADGDITVGNDLRIFRSNVSSNDSGGGGELLFPNNVNRTVEIFGDLRLEYDGALVEVNNPNSTQNIHSLIVHGDIYQNSANGGVDGLNLYTSDGDDYIDLQLRGEGTHNYTRASGDVPSIGTLLVDKGSDASSVFTFNDDFTLLAPTDGSPKALQLTNGSLVLDDADIDIDLTTGGADFEIPSTTALQVTQGQVNVGGDDSGIGLDGSLIIDGGTVDMDDPGNNGNNYIEYGSGGNALLEISSGSLTVGSQIRPITTAETGVLKYRQTGGTVIIGQNAGGEDDRGMLQIYNSGSELTHTGGSLTIVRHQDNPSIGALYLNPDDVDLTGSTITLFNGDTPAGQSDFRINSTVPLNNLVINGNNSPTALLNINPLEIDGTLTVNANATLDANVLNLTLNGDFVNDGTYLPNSNTTIFASSGAQSFSGSGSGNFYDLTKSGLGTLTFDKTATINNVLDISEGTLADNGNTVSLLGNLINDGTHTSSGGEGIVMEGSAAQTISRSAVGTSSFGVLTINNSNNVTVPDGLGYDFRVNDKLVLEDGVLDIGGNLLTIAADADIENGSGGTSVSDFSIANMVQTNSSFTDNGLEREFNAVVNPSDLSLVFPVGQSKYTPVDFDIDESSAGSITIRPANEIHPSIIDDAETPTIIDEDNVLQYHWLVTSSGISGFTANSDFHYDAGDVEVTSPYSVADYIPARVFYSNDTWDKAFNSTDFDETNQIIEFPFSNVDQTNIDGDYTAGINDAIPDDIAAYETNGTGGGVYNSSSSWDNPGSIPSGGPVGAIVTVRSGDDLSLNVNNIRLFRTVIESGAVLEIDETVGHRLGIVSGSGTIRVVSNGSSATLPAGYYNDFFTCGGGGLEYDGTGSYDILGGITEIDHLILSGSGNRNLPNNNVLICGDFQINGASLVNVDDRNLEVQGDMVFNSGSFDAGSNNATVALSGTGAQNIDGAFTGSNAFNDFTVNNSGSGISIVNGGNDDVEIDGTLTLTDGVIITDVNNTLTLNNLATVSGGSNNSFVRGPLTRNLSIGGPYDFPIGKGNAIKMTTLNSVGGSTGDWTAEYYAVSALTNSIVDNLTPETSEIQFISGSDYYRINGPNSTSAAVVLPLYGNVSQSEVDNDQLRVMRWNDVASWWENEGGTSAGTASSGTVTSDPVGFSEQLFTYGTEALNSPLPVEFLSFTAEAKQIHIELNWKTASETNNDYFEIQKSVDGEGFVTIGQVDGSGTSKVVNEYTFDDINPTIGKSLYRIKQVDFDGAYDYSKIVEVDYNGTGKFGLNIYPNPTNNQNLNLQINSNNRETSVEVAMFDLSGKLVNHKVITDDMMRKGSVYQWNNLRLNPGIYIIEIHQGLNKAQQKLVVN